MKNTLIYQTTGYDCGPTTLLNAVRFLFEREEIQPMIVRKIWMMGLDSFDSDGELGKAGTSKDAMRYMAAWFTCFAEKRNFPIKAVFLDGQQAVVEQNGPVCRCLEEGGCVLVRVWLGGTGHYVLLTQDLGDGWIGLFDPYARDEITDGPGFRHIPDDPLRKNWLVRVDLLNRTDETDFAMGEPDRREILLLKRSD